MSVIVPFLKRDAAFSPAEVTAMSMALEDVCSALKIAPDAHSAREVIAIRIIDLVRGGVKSSSQLRDRVLAEAQNGSGL